MTKTTSTSKSQSKTAADIATKAVQTDRVKQAEARAKRAELKMERLKEQTIVVRQVHGFIEFLREQSVVGLAIGLVLGTQAKALVDQLVASFINPMVGLLLPGDGTLKQKTFSITVHGKVADFGWGAFASALLTFIIVAALVYYVFKGLGLDKIDKKKEESK